MTKRHHAADKGHTKSGKDKHDKHDHHGHGKHDKHDHDHGKHGKHDHGHGHGHGHGKHGKYGKDCKDDAPPKPTNGNDTLIGSSGDDCINGKKGDDSILGGLGNDKLLGSQGNDTLSGDEGNDTLRGGKGDDMLDGGSGDDSIRGGQGEDILSGGDGNDTLRGGQGDDMLSGGAGNDMLYGGRGNDTLEGGMGDDMLYGRKGNDMLSGDDGNDTLNGGMGNDTLTGGSGEDVFHFNGMFGQDRITDFVLGDDLVRFSGVVEGDMSLSYDGTNTIVSFAGGQTVTIENIDLVGGVDYLFNQGFETDISGWDLGFGVVTRVASGTNGITASEGDFFALFENDLGGSGPLTLFPDMIRPTYPGDWKTSFDVYLDTGWAADEGFNIAVEAASPMGSAGLYVFNVAQDISTGQLLLGISDQIPNFPNDPRQDIETDANYSVVSSTGWYRFEHVFRETTGGTLSVDMNVYDATNTVIFTETIDTAYEIPDEAGGNSYGWFSSVSVDNGLAVDETSLSLVGMSGPTDWFEFV